SERYQLIHATIQRYRLKRMVDYLCKLAGVSRSGYYAWLDAAGDRESREIQDRTNLELIEYIFNQKKQKAGFLQLKMIIENDYCIFMNHKKIRRLMRKYGLVTKIRRANPYKKMANAKRQHRILLNLVNRQHDQGKLGKIHLTDIPYLYYKNGQKAYLSCVKDGCTLQILAHYLATSLEMNIVYKTLDILKQTMEGFEPGTMLHSDKMCITPIQISKRK